MQHFYDGQIRRYITQLVRLCSGFQWQDSSGGLRSIPVSYGDLTRQVANIIKENSENKMPSVPRMAVYITGLELDRERLADATYVEKVNIRERAYDEAGNEYLNTQGKNYTVERIMPTPYMLRVNVDIWSSNTDQKLQIMEQILSLFNPSLEIQTTDNYIDWTSLTSVYLEQISFSNRTQPIGVDSEIDVGTLSFSTPIFISPPAKVKKLGVITQVVANIFDETRGTVDLGDTVPELSAYADTPVPLTKTTTVNSDPETKTDITANINSRGTLSATYQNYGVYITGNIARLVDKREVGTTNWQTIIESYPGTYTAGLSQIRLRTELGSFIVGQITLNPMDETQLTITWDSDTLPTGDVVEGPARNSNSYTSFDKIVEPQNYNPTDDKVAGFRILLLEAINTSENVGGSVGDTPYNYTYDGPDAWKNNDGTDFVANANDVIEWDGTAWQTVIDSTDSTNGINQKNLATGVIYTWTGTDWIKAYEGEYSHGTWLILLDA
jgi:hypothetical protein